MVLIAINQFYFNNKILEEGVYVKAAITNADGYKGGVTVTVRYTFNSREYESRMSSPMETVVIGRQYFIKLIPADPEHVVLLHDNPVPDCLSDIETQAKGWSEIPVCK